MHDMKNLQKISRLNSGAPEAMQAFTAFDRAVFKEGALSILDKQLMAVAVALTTQCVYCLEIHKQEARKAGPTTYASHPQQYRL